MGISGTVRREGVSYGVAVGNRAFMTEGGTAVPNAAVEKMAALAEAGQTPLLLSVAGSGGAVVAGVLALADALRPESASVVARLRALGVRVVMKARLSGHRSRNRPQ